MPRLRAIVIADDITGANDTGSRFASNGYRTRVSFGEPDDLTTDVAVIDTETREVSSEEAYDAVASAVGMVDAAVVYKKLDSTLRGNIAAELRAIVDTVTPDILLVAPAYPENGRTTENGVQLVNGRPTLETLDGSEPLPMSSEIPELLSTLPYAIEPVSLGTVEAGTAAIRSRLVEIRSANEAPVIAVADATSTAHLRSLACVGQTIDSSVAYAGSGGLAGALSLDPPEDGSVLAVLGSISPTAFSQLDAVDADSVVLLDPTMAIEDPVAAAEDAAGIVLDTQRRHGYAVVTSARSDADVAATDRAATRLGIDDSARNRRITAALGLTAREVHETRTLDSLLTTGGAVTTAVMDELGASHLELTGIEIDDGIPLARICGGTAAGTLLVTKAGSFGDTTAIANCLDFLDTR